MPAGLKTDVIGQSDVFFERPFCVRENRGTAKFRGRLRKHLQFEADSAAYAGIQLLEKRHLQRRKQIVWIQGAGSQRRKDGGVEDGELRCDVPGVEDIAHVLEQRGVQKFAWPQ